MFGTQGIHGPLDGMLKHLLQGTLAYAGLQVLPPFIGWHVPYVSDEARQQILETWRSRIRSVADATLSSSRALQTTTTNSIRSPRIPTLFD